MANSDNESSSDSYELININKSEKCCICATNDDEHSKLVKPCKQCNSPVHLTCVYDKIGKNQTKCNICSNDLPINKNEYFNTKQLCVETLQILVATLYCLYQI